MKLSSLKQFNAWQLKLMMTFLMVFDHLHYIDGFISDDLASVFNIMTRCVAPVFAYLAVEGVVHTRNLKRYNIRLFVWAGITLLGNSLINLLLYYKGSTFILHDNIFFTLAMGVLCISIVKYADRNAGTVKWMYLLLAAVCFVAGFIAMWGVVLLPFMVTVYLFRKDNIKRYISYAVIEGIAFLFRSEYLYVLALPFIGMYNGERGPNSKFHKYFFYVFYPLHLWVIVLIKYIRL